MSRDISVTWISAAGLLALVLLSGCASSDVMHRTSNTQGQLPRPDRIIVYDFAATPAEVDASAWLTGRYSTRAAPQTAEEVRLGHQLANLVAASLVRDISDMGITAQRAGAGPAPRIGDILILGQFLTVDSGSRTERVLIGFGKGSGELRTHVEGYRLEQGGHRLLGTREIKAEGGNKPGMMVPAIGSVAMGSPVGLIVGGVVNVTKETGSEKIQAAAERTAEEIASELRAVFRRQGWI